jgi:hypothetical protein
LYAPQLKGDPNVKNRISIGGLYSWDRTLEDYELQAWFPWWAPKCVIGHLYVRFQCAQLYLPKQRFDEITNVCGGEITRERWIERECSWLVESFALSARSDWVGHRLPVWLVLLPSRTGLVPCLYASIYCRDSFQIKDSLAVSIMRLMPLSLHRGHYHIPHQSTVALQAPHCVQWMKRPCTWLSSACSKTAPQFPHT